MASAEFHDDGLSVGGDTYDGAEGAAPGRHKGKSLLTRFFASCESDATGSVHRAWAVTVLFSLAFFAISCVEATKLQRYGSGAASVALEIAAFWTAALHLLLAAVGTFILRSFPTAFAVGGFLGVTTVVSQQNLLLFVGFYHYQHGDPVFNLIFADLALALAVVLAFFSLILGHFRHHIIVR